MCVYGANKRKQSKFMGKKHPDLSNPQIQETSLFVPNNLLSNILKSDIVVDSSDLLYFPSNFPKLSMTTLL